jgi:hypothetical protein
MTAYRNIIPKVEQVQEVTVTDKTTYHCKFPGCKYTTEEDYEAQLHYGANHAIQGIFHIGDVTFYLFISHADFEAFVEANRHHGGYDCQWSGPGWYGSHVDESNKYTEFHLHNALFYQAWWEAHIKQAQYEIERLNQNLTEFNRHVKDLSAPPLSDRTTS